MWYKQNRCLKTKRSKNSARRDGILQLFEIDIDGKKRNYAIGWLYSTGFHGNNAS